MKKKKAAGIICGLILTIPAYAAVQGSVPESVHFSEEVHILPAIGETFDLRSVLEIEGQDMNKEMVYSVFDDSVVQVSQEGELTAIGYGMTTVIASAMEDETISAGMDVEVLDLYGTYTGSKTIEMMGCEITINVELNEDGTFSYYRAPMEIKLTGGGEMKALKDEGKYKIKGNEILFTGAETGEYTAVLEIKKEDVLLKGKLPTGGGPATEMELIRFPKEIEETETEIPEEAGQS